MEKLWKLKQLQLGSVADYTIEFRRLAGRLNWPDEVLTDIIGKGLLDKVREEFDKVDKPTTLFEATNLIIGIDKKCYLENLIRNKPKPHHHHHKSFNRRKNELNKTESNFKSNHHKKNKFKNDILSANYTPAVNSTITSTFYVELKGKNIKTNLLIDSGSARSFICKNFAIANKIPTSGLSSPINIQLPNRLLNRLNKNLWTIQKLSNFVSLIYPYKESMEFLVETGYLYTIPTSITRPIKSSF